MKPGYYNLLLLVFTALLVACESDVPKPMVTNPFTKGQNNHSVYIICEGNFNWGNASLSYYNSETKLISNDIFKQKNQRDLGDVFQSMSFFDNKAFLMINNSAKIEVVNPDDFSSVATITKLNSPRYFLGISPEKAYVTHIYGDSISVINLQNYSKYKSIYCKGWTEQLVKILNKAYVTNCRSNSLYIIDTEKDLLIDSIAIGSGTNAIAIDKNYMIWVSTMSNTANNTPSKLLQINPITHKISKEFIIHPSQNPNGLCLNNSLDSLYFLHNGVHKMSINAQAIPNTPIVKQANASVFYGLGIEPITNNIYIADALDYNQQGLVKIYNPKGDSLSAFKVGIIPNGFFFR